MSKPDVPAYLEALDNEDSDEECTYCGNPVWDQGTYPDLCRECNYDAYQDSYEDRLYDEYEDDYEEY